MINIFIDMIIAKVLTTLQSMWGADKFYIMAFEGSNLKRRGCKVLTNKTVDFRSLCFRVGALEMLKRLVWISLDFLVC